MYVYRILGEVVAVITQSDLEKACGIDQLYSGLCLGLEGAVYAAI